MPDAPLRVLVADDERLGRKRLLDLLAREPGIEIVADVATGRAAVAALRQHAPDVAFLDIQMPDLTGLEVVRAVGPRAMPVTVFVTAYDHHALDAFRLAALDYLVKPFDDERFAEMMARVRETVHLLRLEAEAAALRERYDALLAASPEPSQVPAALTALPVRRRGRVRFVPVSEIDVMAADGPYVILHTGGTTYPIRAQMQTLEARLDPAQFVRIHRTTIVRTACIVEMHVGANGDYAVRLTDGSMWRLARGRREAVEAQLRRRR